MNYTEHQARQIAKYSNKGLNATEIATLLHLSPRKVQRVLKEQRPQATAPALLPAKAKAINYIAMGFTYSEVAKMLKVSKSSVYLWNKAHRQATTPAKGCATHKIKIAPSYFAEVLTGRKTFEVRQNDRNYKNGDIVILQEYDTNRHTYTGREITKQITYILDSPEYCKDGFIIFSIV